MTRLSGIKTRFIPFHGDTNIDMNDVFLTQCSLLDKDDEEKIGFMSHHSKEEKCHFEPYFLHDSLLAQMTLKQP